MTTEGTTESGRRAFLRFGLSGVVFTILGPGLFWLAYPLGPFVAVAVAELLVHALRFAIFRKLVFPAHKGYRVSLPRYVLSALPVSLTVNVPWARAQETRSRTCPCSVNLTALASRLTSTCCSRWASPRTHSGAESSTRAASATCRHSVTVTRLALPLQSSPAWPIASGLVG